MALFYSLAGVTFIGGSLVDHGGHTPFEPVQFGSALLHGPHVGNFDAAYADLPKAARVQNAEELAQAWIRLVDPEHRAKQADIARATLARQQGDLEELINRLVQLL